MANTSDSFDLSTAVPVDTDTDLQPVKTTAAKQTDFDLSTAKPVADSSAGKSTVQAISPSDPLRQVALTGRAASQGVVGALTLLPTLFTAARNTPAFIANHFFGGNYPYAKSPAEAFSTALTKLGAPVPQTSGEQLASAGVSGLTGGLSGGGLTGIPGVLNAVRSGAAGTAGAVSQEGARQIGLPTWMQFGAGLLGGHIPAMGEDFARTGASLLAPLTKSGQTQAAGTLLNSQSNNPNALTNLMLNKPTVPNSMPTAGAASQDTGLLGVEKAMRGTSSPDFAERISAQNAARQAELTSIGGTSNDLRNAIDARSQTTAPLYAAAAQQSAPIDNEMVSLMQRPAMQAAIAKAKEMAENNGKSFGLSSNAPGAPMALSGADLQGMKLALDDMRTTGFSQGLGTHQQRAIQNTSDALKGWMQKNVPAQREADMAFENMSGPVNKMQTVQGLQQKASTTQADMGTGQYFLSPASYSRALDDVLAEPRNGLGNADITRLEAIRKDLQNSTAVSSPLLKAPGSDTFQNLSLNQSMGSSFAAPLAKLLSPVYKLGGADQGVNSLLTRAMLDPQFAASLMQGAAKPKPGLNFRPYDAGIAGGLLGSQNGAQ